MTRIAGQKPQITLARKSIATFKVREGYPVGCKVTLRRALAIQERASGAEALAVAEVLDNLGSVLEIQARYAEAEPTHERALAIRERALGPNCLWQPAWTTSASPTSIAETVREPNPSFAGRSPSASRSPARILSKWRRPPTGSRSLSSCPSSRSGTSHRPLP